VNPLFQVNFRVATGPPTVLALEGLDITPLEVDVGFARFDLALELQLRDDEIRGYVEYNTDLFRAETAERLARDFEALLADALARPDVPLLALGLAGERSTQNAAVPRPSIKSFRDRAASPAAPGTTVISS
jgi:non-ribosomal peptide synthetase component F